MERELKFLETRMTSKSLRVERFLGEMEEVVPWEGLCKAIEPYYKDGKGGPPSV